MARTSPSPVAPTPGRAPEVVPGRRAPGLVAAALAAVGIVVLWRVFVVTRTGQLLDEAAFDGSRYGRSRLWHVAEPVLETISLPFLVAVLVGTMLLAVVRRRFQLALRVAVLMAGANLTTQVLKHVVIERPDFGIGWYVGNTLPSGHTTAAASVSAALLMVVPRRLRPTAAVVGAVYTGATGVSTLVGRWHRPSDVVAALLVVVAWVGIAYAVGRHDRVPEGPDPVRRTRAVVALLVSGALIGSVGALVALQRSLGDLDGGLGSRGELLTAYGGGALGVAASVCAAFAIMLMLARAAEARPVR